MDIEAEIKRHFEEDRTNFQRMDDKFLKLEDLTTKQNETLGKILIHAKTTSEFMENMHGFNDFVKGFNLLKSPFKWVLAFVVGIIALFGGFKTIISWFLPIK